MSAKKNENPNFKRFYISVIRHNRSPTLVRKQQTRVLRQHQDMEEKLTSMKDQAMSMTARAGSFCNWKHHKVGLNSARINLCEEQTPAGPPMQFLCHSSG
jgi:hypothetical protein